MNRKVSMKRPLLLMGAALFVNGAVFAAAITPRLPAQQTAPDNTRVNKGDAEKGVPTADKQKMNPADREITRKIRSAIMDDKSLSTYAHNVKIITQDGKVTLKGPVRTEKEKAEVEAKAAAVAGETNVTSQVDVAPPKS